MKKTFFRGVAFFALGLVLMQALFTGGSKKASADHSENAKIVSLPSVMTMYMANTKTDASAPAPFNTSVPYGICAGAIQDANKSTYELCYCIDYSKIANTSDSLSSKSELASALLTNEQAMLINTTMLLGYNKQNFTTSGLTATDKDSYFATQALVWIIKEGYFYKATERAAAEKFFFEKMPSIKTYYQSLYNKVIAQVSVPSFVTTTENEMKYNTANSKFELTLTNTNQGAMNTLVVDTKSLPEGVTATVNGENIVLSSTKEIKTATKIKLTKVVQGKGGLVAWKNTSGDKQPQVTIDYDLSPIAQQLEISIKTEPIVSIQPVKDPDVSIQPVKDPDVSIQPVKDPDVSIQPVKDLAVGIQSEESKDKQEEVVYQTKEVDANKEAMDASPKTADESSITLAYRLIGASLFTMMSLYVVSVINKRKQKF